MTTRADFWSSSSRPAPDSPAHEERGLDLGAFDYITKPFTVDRPKRVRSHSLSVPATPAGRTGDDRQPDRNRQSPPLTMLRWKTNGGAAPATAARLSLIVVHVDHFKAYNDHLGHAEGDVVLRQVARDPAEHRWPTGSPCCPLRRRGVPRYCYRKPTPQPPSRWRRKRSWASRRCRYAIRHRRSRRGLPSVWVEKPSSREGATAHPEFFRGADAALAHRQGNGPQQAGLGVKAANRRTCRAAGKIKPPCRQRVHPVQVFPDAGQILRHIVQAGFASPCTCIRPHSLRRPPPPSCPHLPGVRHPSSCRLRDLDLGRQNDFFSDPVLMESPVVVADRITRLQSSR